ncbi:efflux transporter periplasmic adaptor subunit [Halovibrio salipaludis]|uniref:Efflux transporter periplasmic adaptor subunit n=1 Tax=Halovibrio salipaludis TaxID=2032626 RepID=A0A2A2EXE6_9GAMM|nr:efflux RND transporter periplasmic adaptor subunit [Halovibrio salipaludis]PAU77049.1 efflux transporter periplasmic adaptor subunit [Halovibrio salipaludis]
MKVWLFILALLIGAAAGSGGLYVWMHGTAANGGGDGEREILYYRHPMDSSITSDTPDKDSMGMDYIPVYAGDEEEGEGDDSPGTVSIKPQVTQNLGVRTAMAKQGDLTPGVDALGFVEYNESELEHVHVRAEGWVEDLKVRTTGESVDKGQILFRTDSPRLQNAQEELLQAHRRNSGVDSARQRLRSLGMADEDIRTVEQRGDILRLVPVRARQSGVVRELNFSEGMHVNPSQTLMEIADLSSVWVMLEVFEPQMGALRTGQSTRVSLPFRPGWERQAELDFVYPNLDTDSRVQRARLTLDNADGELRPGMYTQVALDGETVSDAVHVPAESVIRTGEQNRIVVMQEEGSFQVREVRIGRRIGDRMVIREGVKPHESVVVSSQFLIDSESSTVAELDRMDAGGASDADEPDAETDVWTRGQVKDLDIERGTVKLAHDPVPEWDWPAMTMNFGIGDGVDEGHLQPGMEMRFRIRERDGDGYEITGMKPVREEEASDD